MCAALESIVKTAERPDIRFDIRLRQGDIKFINNDTMLHYRSEFVDHPEAARKRDMLHMRVNFHEGRWLDLKFADRHNAWVRAGVATCTGNGQSI